MLTPPPIPHIAAAVGPCFNRPAQMGPVLTLVSALVLGPNPVWRSVGDNPGPIDSSAAGARTLSIAAGRATFSGPVSDRVGRGDVVQYDSDGDGVPDQLAFVTKRFSRTSFDVANRTTGAPVSVASTTSWSIFRAYRTLAAAVNTAARPGLELGGTENPLIHASLRDFDTFVGGRDVASAGYVWSVACYDDGTPDDSLVWIGAPWVTDQDHRISIFTPVNATEVGVSQRHDGTWGKGYRRTHALHIDEVDVSVEGLAMRQARQLAASQLDNRVLAVHSRRRGSRIDVLNCYGEHADSAGAARAFEFFDDGQPFDAGMRTTIRAWNNIGLTWAAAGSGGAAFASDTGDDLYLFNCTGAAPNGAAAFLSDNSTGAAKSSSIVNGLGYSDGGPAVALGDGGLPFLIASTAVNDLSIDDTTNALVDGGNAVGQTFAFVFPPTDLHLAEIDTGARGRGLSLSGNPLAPFSTDLDGQPRNTPWDVGADEFFLPGLPAVVTGTATVLAPDSVRLRANGDGNASPSTIWFRYAQGTPLRCDDSFGTRVPAQGDISIGSSGNVSVDEVVTGLTPGGTYSFCALAGSVAGIRTGSLVPFTMTVTQTDGGAGGEDGGTTEVLPQRFSVGCGCGQAGATAWWGALVLMLRRRRRRGEQAAEEVRSHRQP